MYRETAKSTLATYHLALAASVLTEFRHVLTYIGDDSVGVHSQLGLRTE